MNKPFQLADTSTKAAFTTAEYLRMGESGAFDDMKIELVDGELERMNRPLNDHSRRQTLVIIRLAMIVGEALVRGDVGVDLGGETVLGCDAALLRHTVEGQRLLVPDDLALVVEVAQTSLARDKGLKRVRYAAAGIPEYWVVDGDRAVVHVYREPVDGDYALISTVRFGEPLAVPGTGATITVS